MPAVELDDYQQALVDSAVGVASRSLDRPGADVAGLWRELGEVGVFDLVGPGAAGGVLELAAVVEGLGRIACPGPFAATCLGALLLDEPERSEVVAGRVLVGLVSGDLIAWGASAGVLIEVAGDRAWRAEVASDLEAVETLAGEPWARASCRRLEAFSAIDRALAVADLVTAAWVVGAADGLMARVSEHARQRRQFGRAIGDFQAVAHRLAAAHAELVGARGLVLLAARAADAEPPAHLQAAAARLAGVRAGLAVAYAAHQIMGGLGFSTESGLGAVTTAIRQAASLPPGGDRARELLAGADPVRLS